MKNPIKFLLNWNKSPVEQIIEQVEQLVARGVCQPGDKLPGAGTLAHELHISRVTVQKAYGMLIERKIVEGRIGEGTFIVPKHDTPSLSLQRHIAPIIVLGINLSLSQTEIREAFEFEISRHFSEQSGEPHGKRRRVSKKR